MFEQIMKRRFVIFAVAISAITATAAEHAQVTPFGQMKTTKQIRDYTGYTLAGFVRDVVFVELNKFQSKIDKEEASFPGKYSKWQDDLTAAGYGVAVGLDENNYLFNVGYGNGTHIVKDPKTGNTQNADTKSGRSYGVYWNKVTGEKHESDPSYPAYFKELKDFFTTESENVPLLYHVIIQILTNSDASALGQLSVPGQKVVTDFTAIYIAERDRNVMVQESLQNHPWQIDHALTTLLSQAVVVSGKMLSGSHFNKDKFRRWTTVDRGTLVAFDLPQWTQPGKTSGSGVGMTREDRVAFQQLLAEKLADDADAQNDINTVKQITGLPLDGKAAHGGDVFQATLEFMNQKGSPTKLDSATQQQLAGALENYLAEVAKVAAEL